MKAAVLHAREDLRFAEVPTPEIGDSEVLIKIRATGICGSDIPRVNGNGAHYFPIILGHEFSGDVFLVGKDVTSVKTGDRATGAPLIPCLKCEDCKKGDYALCKNYTFIGSRISGSFAEYVKLPEINTVKFDSSIPYEKAAFFEPSTVALHGVNCAKYHGGEDVAILGGGTIGMFTAQWAKIYGAKRVFVFDIDDDRLELAKKLGADITINTKDANFKEIVKDLTNNKGFGFVFETAGVDATMKLAFEIAANKSSVCYIGTPTKDLTLTPQLLELMLRKEFTLIGSWMSYSAPFPGKEWLLTAHYFATGVLKYDEGLIFKKLPLSEIASAFEMYKTQGLVKGKILLVND